MNHRCIILAMLPLVIVCFCSFYKVNNIEYDNKSVQNDEYGFAIHNCSGITFESDESSIKENIDKELDEIYARFSELLPSELSSGIAPLGVSGIDDTFATLKESFLSAGARAATGAIRLVAICILFALAEMLCTDADIGAVVRSSVAVCLSVPVLTLASDMIDTVKLGIVSGSDFFSGVIPIACTVISIGRGAASAAAASSGMSLSLSFVSAILSNYLFPIAVLIFLIAMVSSYDTGGGVCGVSRGVRDWFNFGIGIASAAVVAILSFQTVIAASADSITLRGAKYAVANMIPIVGNVVSGALSTLSSGVKILSSGIGAMSVAAVIYFMGAPLATLLFYRLALGICASLLSFAGAVFGQRFFESVRCAVDCVIGVGASALTVYILNVAVFMSIVSGGGI